MLALYARLTLDSGTPPTDEDRIAVGVAAGVMGIYVPEGRVGIQFDLLNDVLGLLLILLGVSALRRSAVGDRVKWEFGLVYLIVLALMTDAVLRHVLFARPPWLMYLDSLFSILRIVGVMVFVLAMWQASIDWSLRRAGSLWKATVVCLLILGSPPI